MSEGRLWCWHLTHAVPQKTWMPSLNQPQTCAPRLLWSLRILWNHRLSAVRALSFTGNCQLHYYHESCPAFFADNRRSLALVTRRTEIFPSSPNSCKPTTSGSCDHFPPLPIPRFSHPSCYSVVNERTMKLMIPGATIRKANKRRPVGLFFRIFTFTPPIFASTTEMVRVLLLQSNCN